MPCRRDFCQTSRSGIALALFQPLIGFLPVEVGVRRGSAKDQIADGVAVAALVGRNGQGDSGA